MELIGTCIVLQKTMEERGGDGVQDVWSCSEDR